MSVCADCPFKDKAHCTAYDEFLCADGEKKRQESNQSEKQ